MEHLEAGPHQRQEDDDPAPGEAQGARPDDRQDAGYQHHARLSQLIVLVSSNRQGSRGDACAGKNFHI